MRFLVFSITAICLLIVSNTFAQDVAVFYDAAVEGGRGLAVNNPAQLADMHDGKRVESTKTNG